ncbi:MAG: biotin/lipoyl-binding protein [Tepidisphaeraceae bacterium]
MNGSAVEVKTVRVRLPDVGAPATASSDAIALDANGYVVAAHKVELASKVIGRVAWVGVEMGDAIKAGQELVRLEDDEYRARVMQAEGQLAAAKAKLAELVAGARTQEIATAQAKLDEALAELAGARAMPNASRR